MVCEGTSGSTSGPTSMSISDPTTALTSSLTSESSSLILSLSDLITLGVSTFRVVSILLNQMPLQMYHTGIELPLELCLECHSIQYHWISVS